MERKQKIYLGTNTKMYKTIAQTKTFLTELAQLTSDIPRDKLELFVIPSFTTLEAARKCVPTELITLGAQNMGWEDEGQFTGEISPLMLREVGMQIVEIGHSERRHVLGETDEQEMLKLRCALRHGFTPLLCVGETARQKELGITDEVLRTQLKIALHGVQLDKKLWVAYEPVWAIGVSGTPASKEYADEKHKVIRQALVEIMGSMGEEVPILYGGSVNEQNASELIEMPNVDGLFIGRSAWQAEGFNSIIRNVMPLFFARRAREAL